MIISLNDYHGNKVKWDICESYFVNFNVPACYNNNNIVYSNAALRLNFGVL